MLKSCKYTRPVNLLLVKKKLKKLNKHVETTSENRTSTEHQQDFNKKYYFHTKTKKILSGHMPHRKNISRGAYGCKKKKKKKFKTLFLDIMYSYTVRF